MVKVAPSPVRSAQSPPTVLPGALHPGLGAGAPATVVRRACGESEREHPDQHEHELPHPASLVPPPSCGRQRIAVTVFGARACANGARIAANREPAVPWRAMSQAAEIEALASRSGDVPRPRTPPGSSPGSPPSTRSGSRSARPRSRSVRSSGSRSSGRSTSAIRSLDLTTLEGADTVGKVIAMCAKAVRPNPVRPNPPGGRGLHLPPSGPGRGRAAEGHGREGGERRRLVPGGLGPLGARLAEIREVVDLGAHEVDMVLNRSYFLGGQYAQCFEEVVARARPPGTPTSR